MDPTTDASKLLLAKRDVATILAGLRLLQYSGFADEFGYIFTLTDEDIAEIRKVLTDGGTLTTLTCDEIDRLCETIKGSERLACIEPPV